MEGSAQQPELYDVSSVFRIIVQLKPKVISKAQILCTLLQDFSYYTQISHMIFQRSIFFMKPLHTISIHFLFIFLFFELHELLMTIFMRRTVHKISVKIRKTNSTKFEAIYFYNNPFMHHNNNIFHVHCKFLRVRKPLYLSSHGTFESITYLHTSWNQNAYSLFSKEISHPYCWNDTRHNWLIKKAHLC